MLDYENHLNMNKSQFRAETEEMMMDPIVKPENICLVRSYAGYSLGGHGAQSAKKVNQDSIVM
jgi:hypothetical protein